MPDSAHTPDGGGLTEARFGGVVPGVYQDGNVNHVLQPVIGWLSMDLHDGKPVTAEQIQQAIDRMAAACDAEDAWLAARATPADPRETVTEWGARYEDGTVRSCGWMPGISEAMAHRALEPASQHVVPPPCAVAVVTRQRTSYADTVTEWQDADSRARAADLRAGVHEGRDT